MGEKAAWRGLRPAGKGCAVTGAASGIGRATFERLPGFRESLLGFDRCEDRKPAEVAAAIASLSSDATSFITGEALAVEGGLLAR
jgi:NAD(P)-dependent dehydrogenase (short-subunit alcohol dehydrogenase family)